MAKNGQAKVLSNEELGAVLDENGKGEAEDFGLLPI